MKYWAHNSSFFSILKWDIMGILSDLKRNDLDRKADNLDD